MIYRKLMNRFVQNRMFIILRREVYYLLRYAFICHIARPPCTETRNMSKTVTRGALIVFEGGDKSGKSTQTQKLVDAFIERGKKAKLLKFPDRTTATGQMINDYLKEKENAAALEDHAIHLLFTANRWEAVPNMLSLLQGGTTLVVDRYSYSGVAYSAAKPGMSLNWCKQPEIGLPKPDVVVYLSVPVSVAATRGSYGDERYEDVETQTKVAKNYELLAVGPEWIKFDAAKDIDKLHAEIMLAVSQAVKRLKNNEVEKLWVDDAPQESP